MPRNAVLAQKKTKHKVWIGTYAILAVVCLVAYFLFRLQVFYVIDKSLVIVKKATLAGFFVFVVMIVSRYIEMITMKESRTAAVGYNLVRLVRFITAIIVLLIIVSAIFANWYTAAVSLGLGSLLLGFSLQTPISSLIGWIYIILRNPYRVGDRVQIGTIKGDVMEISYLDTTLWEFGGNYLTNDLPSGRLVSFPNSQIFQQPVFNYSWRKFPHIWNEISFYFSFGSDAAFIEETLKRVTEEVLKAQLAENADELEIEAHPIVSFRTNSNAWMEATLTYLVSPKKTADIRSAILKKAITELRTQPGKISMPNEMK